jgi:diaminohydroxyphosphoribosylaminopyrimidine deaminase / 5-amino-6-(5-phosphoribosylamino)uracil reductase
VTDRLWMAQALSRAAEALGDTAPNPAVGAVIVGGGVLLGEGATQPAGSDHAEVRALADARARGHDVRGATMFVTLEPCCHHGRTPPCTDAIVQAGIARVVVGVVDPFPPMRGRALALLREAGVEVVLGVEARACAQQIRGFVRAVTAGLPEVTLKVAVSADGHLATATGESKWITSEAARADGHRLRASHDAVLVGIGTVLADDPMLTTRLAVRRSAVDAVPVVLDTELRIPETAQLLARRPIVVCATDAPERALRAEVIRVPRGPGGVDLTAALRAVAARGLHRVLVEGGARVHRSLVDAGLADTLVLYVGPVLIPGGTPWLGGPAIRALADAVPMELAAAERVGPDARLTYVFPRPSPPETLTR